MKWLKRALLVAAFASAPAAGIAAEKREGGAAATAAADGAVEVVKNVAYGADAERQALDLYLPRGQQNFPVVVFFHGGGFSKGSRADAARFGEALAKQGVGVVAAGYRLAPSAKHPEHARDAAKAFAWAAKNIGAKGGDPARLFLAGHSAGGLLATLIASDPQYLEAEGLTGKPVAGVISLSGAYKVGEARQEIFGDAASRKAASPLTHVRAGLPPFLLAYADADNPGKDAETREFADALKGANVTVAALEAKNRKHGTIFTEIAGPGDQTGDAVVAFVRNPAGAAR